MTTDTWDQSMTVTKLDAAERQTRTAVRLFFGRDDPVSAHTLASAANAVLHNLLESGGGGGVSRNRALINPKHWKKWIASVKEVENFLKHADRDADATIRLCTGLTACALIETCMLLEVVAQRTLVETGVMLLWGMHAFPDMFHLKDEHRALIQQDKANDFELWSLALDDPAGLISATLCNRPLPPTPKAPHDLYLWFEQFEDRTKDTSGPGGES